MQQAPTNGQSYRPGTADDVRTMRKTH